MDKSNYTEEQKNDINERVEKAVAYLNEMQLHPATLLQLVNTGDDIFATKAITFLQDTKYTSSPIQKDDL